MIYYSASIILSSEKIGRAPFYFFAACFYGLLNELFWFFLGVLFSEDMRYFWTSFYK